MSDEERELTPEEMDEQLADAKRQGEALKHIGGMFIEMGGYPVDEASESAVEILAVAKALDQCQSMEQLNAALLGTLVACHVAGRQRGGAHASALLTLVVAANGGKMVLTQERIVELQAQCENTGVVTEPGENGTDLVLRLFELDSPEDEQEPQDQQAPQEEAETDA